MFTERGNRIRKVVFSGGGAHEFRLEPDESEGPQTHPRRKVSKSDTQNWCSGGVWARDRNLPDLLIGGHEAAQKVI